MSYFKRSTPFTTFPGLIQHVFKEAYSILKAIEHGTSIEIDPNGPTGLAVFIEDGPHYKMINALRNHIKSEGVEDFTDAVLGARTLCGVAVGGLKLWRPTAKECRALENVAINIPWSMYSQPFETMVILVPDQYVIYDDANHRRIYSIVIRYTRECKLLSLEWLADDGTFYTNWVCHIKEDELLVENSLLNMLNKESYNTSFYKVCVQVWRIALNACLLLSQHTISVSDDNKLQRDKAKKKAADKSLPEHIQEINARATLAIPEIYVLDQKIKVYDESKLGDHAHNGDGGAGTTKSPHWRRGHWANQAYGEGFKERKLIFKRPTFVNAHLFEGELKDTTVSMVHVGAAK